MYGWVYILIQASLVVIYFLSVYKEKEKSVRRSRLWLWLFLNGLMVILYAFVRIE